MPRMQGRWSPSQRTLSTSSCRESSQCISRGRCSISCERCHFNSNNKSSCRWSSDLISGWRCIKSNSSCDSCGSPRQGGADSTSCGNCQPETQLRAVLVGAENVTQLQTVDQNMADAQTDHDMADVAVVEHPHPHEDEEHVEREHPDKVYFDEDDGTALDLEQVRAGVEREMVFMDEVAVGEPCNRPKKGKVWSTPWCYRRKGDAVRSRLEVRQSRERTDSSVHAGTPGPAAARILLILSAICSLFAATADFRVAFCANTNDRRSVCGTSRGGKLAKRHGLAIAKSPHCQRTMRGGSLPSTSGELT